PMSKAELLEKIDKGWNDFNAFLMTLTPPQVTIHRDAAGWRGLDHVIHLADWENGMLALLNKQDRAAGMGVDQRFVDKIQSLSDEDLQRPYKYYQPDSDREAPVIKWVQMNTYNHYAEHTPWIAAIAADDKQMTKAVLLDKI